MMKAVPGKHENGRSATRRALHVCTRYQRGGSERRIRDIVTSLPELDHEVIVGNESDLALASRQLPAATVTLLPNLHRPVSPLDDLRVVFELTRLIQRRRYNIIFTHQSKAGALGRMASILANRTPVVHSLSMASFGPGYSRLESRIFEQVERMLLRRTALFCTVGHDLARRYQELGVDPSRLVVVRSGTNLPARLIDRAEARRLLSEAHDVPVNGRLVIYVGSLEPRKNVLDLPLTLKLLRDSRPADEFVLAIAGSGVEAARIEGKCQELGVRPWVFMLGHLEDTGTLFNAADALLLLSQVEGLPQVLVQAAAVGLPFVAYNVDGVGELLEMGATGRAVAMGDLGGAAAAVGRMVEMPPGHLPIDLGAWQPGRIRTDYRDAIARAVPALALDGP